MTSAYKDVLQKYSGSAEYTLYDIDKDGIHELIAYDGWEYDYIPLSILSQYLAEVVMPIIVDCTPLATMT